MGVEPGGTTSGWFKLPTAQAEMLCKAVQAFAAPRRRNPDAWVDAEGRRRPYATIVGMALADLVEHLPTDKLPQSGGVAASVVITLDLETLRTDLGVATLDTGTPVSAGQARRMACNAGLIPTVLGSESVPLDLGRSARLHTTSQRVAMALRDGGSPPAAVTGYLPGARPTTRSHGARAAAPRSSTDGSCAPTTITWPTTTATT